MRQLSEFLNTGDLATLTPGHWDAVGGGWRTENVSAAYRQLTPKKRKEVGESSSRYYFPWGRERLGVPR